MLTEVFWVSFVSTVTGMIIALARICYKSKCREVTFCCVKVIRDTTLEVQEEANRIDLVNKSGDAVTTTTTTTTDLPRLTSLKDSTRSLMNSSPRSNPKDTVYDV